MIQHRFYQNGDFLTHLILKHPPIPLASITHIPTINPVLYVSDTCTWEDFYILRSQDHWVTFLGDIDTQDISK